MLAALFITEYSVARTRQLADRRSSTCWPRSPACSSASGASSSSPDQIVPLSRWLTDHLGWIPIFKTDPGASLTGSIFIAGIVVSLMVLPIITSVVREVFAQTPPGEKEAALALGGTRWGMIRAVVLPYGRGGIIGGSMLGLGRALGETIAVLLLLPQVPEVTGKILQNGGATISGFIAQRAGADAFTTSGLMAAGLVLFVITLGDEHDRVGRRRRAAGPARESSCDASRDAIVDVARAARHVGNGMRPAARRTALDRRAGSAPTARAHVDRPRDASSVAS